MSGKARTHCAKGHLLSGDNLYQSPGGQRQCRTCQIERAKAAYARNPEPQKNRSRKSKLAKLGVTPEQYDLLNEAQDGRCAICGKREKLRRLAVDHRHSDGLVRGLLCVHCNYHLLGILGEDVEKYRNVVRYLTDPPAPRVIGVCRAPDAPPVLGSIPASVSGTPTKVAE